MDSPGKESSDNELQLTKVLEIRLDKYKGSRDPSSRPTMSGSPLINGASVEALGAITTPELHPISVFHRNCIPSPLYRRSSRSHHITSHGILCRGVAYRTGRRHRRAFHRVSRMGLALKCSIVFLERIGLVITEDVTKSRK